MMQRWIQLGFCLIVCYGQTSSFAQSNAFNWSGTKQLYAVSAKLDKQRIGSVTFEPKSHDITHFSLDLDMTLFKDYFLSMKEFKCLEGQEVSCYVPYPYANPHTIVKGDLAWLEHSLLFLFKSPKDFGAKLWNGTYFHFEVVGHQLVGHAQAIDLNYISAPSDHPETPPYTPDLRSDYPDGARWLNRLIIE